MIIKSVCNGTPFTVGKISASNGAGTRNRLISRPALNLLRYRGSRPELTGDRTLATLPCSNGPPTSLTYRLTAGVLKDDICNSFAFKK